MRQTQTSKSPWANCRIGITGANGSLGRALTNKLREKGAVIIGLTHGEVPVHDFPEEGPQEWVKWSCGQEVSLESTLAKLDILILNHGINPKGSQSQNDLNNALEINALSSWRLMECFEKHAINQNKVEKRKEIWVNTSEAEIQPALSPAYEISKRLLGQLVSIRWSNLKSNQQNHFTIRKLVLGPFHSELNPLGIMSANWVATQIIKQAEFNLNLIIVTPNPLTYIAMPLTELFRSIYSQLMNKYFQNN